MQISSGQRVFLLNSTRLGGNVIKIFGMLLLQGLRDTVVVLL